MYANLTKILPEVEEAETLFYQKLEQLNGNGKTRAEMDDEYAELVAEFNIVLEKAIEAYWQDTKHVNSKTTLQQIFRGRDRHNTHFGVSPKNVIRKLCQMEETV